MIHSKKTNHPTWHSVYTYSNLPERLVKLRELAYNLWWIGKYEVRELFETIAPYQWEKSKGNPVCVLASLTKARQEELLSDASFMERLDRVYDEFTEYMSRPFRLDAPSVAYFSMEYGLTNVLRIYSGGLGVLAGDYLKEASDSNVNMVGVGFLYREGYFEQVIAPDGQQLANYEAQNFNNIPAEQLFNEDGSPMILEVPFKDHIVYSNVWKVSVGRVSLYLMDTDLSINSDWDRVITHQLYGGDWENRMKQEYMLGIGGILLLRQLGIEQEVYHCNEGHAALINIERIAHLVAGGMDFDHALEVVRASALYTVHTPVPAGHDYFEEELFSKYMSHYAEKLGISFQELIDLGRENPGSDEKFSMSVLALNTCQEANGVSLLHGKVSQNMFAPVWKGYFPDELHVGHVTNGVHMPTWMGHRWLALMKKYVSDDFVRDQADGEVMKRIMDIPDSEVWGMRKSMKERLVRYLRRRYEISMTKENGTPSKIMDILEALDPNALIIGFGRRFATYKRAHLLFTDLEQLERIVNNPEYPVQFLFAGKAHPADGGGQGLIKRIHEISNRPEFKGKILFLENYDIRVAQRLIAGVDVWLNTPTRPLEASGTSGMKAVMNGALNLSVLDGWWYEGYVEGAGWALTDKRTYSNQQLQDELDAVTIYNILEDELVPLYYDRTPGCEYSEGWVRMIKKSMSEIFPRFTMKRMIDDYIEKFYIPLSERSRVLKENNYRAVDQIVTWKSRVAMNWDRLEVIDIRKSHEMQNRVFRIGEFFDCQITLDLHELDTELKIELVVTEEDPKNGELVHLYNYPFQLIESNGSRRTYQMEIIVDNPGDQKVAIRIAPDHPLLPHPMDFAYIHWVPLF